MATIGIVAGEASGDLLGSHLIHALKQRRPDLEFVGIAGPKMMSEGAKTLYPMEALSVRGYVEVIKHLPKLLSIRRNLKRYFIQNKPDVFIGIDAPDFNLSLERGLKIQNIPTIHYVSPSIWAWRKNKIRKIKQSVSHILALFPFEPEIYKRAGVPVTYVGHPLADSLPLNVDKQVARENLKIRADKLVVALLPGSRQSEVSQLADLFICTSQVITREHKEVEFLVPLITRETMKIFEEALYHHSSQVVDEPALPIKIMFGHAQMAMEAADVVVVASGTATLEAALLKRPMVITYRMPWLSWQILKRMLYLPYVGLPNILAGRFVVPELLQKDATPEKLADAVLKLANDKQLMQEISEEFNRIHLVLKQNTDQKAAEVVLSFLS